MNDFTASNGIKIRVADGPSGTYLLGVMPTLDQTHATGSVEGIQALREFFQAEADERLGRWRWPENPEYVVYPPSEDDDEDAGLCILFEPGGGSSNRYTREWLAGVVDPEGWAVARCARAYFDAHPEPKPWHGAEPGEVWVFEMPNAEPLAAVATRGNWIGARTGFPIDIASVRSGRRIWPEVAS